MAQHLSGPPGLAGQVALITGGAGGMGRAIAKVFTAAGARVIATDRGEHEEIEAPESYCTNICFGGPDMHTAYITLSGYGHLFEARWPRPGLRLAA